MTRSARCRLGGFWMTPSRVLVQLDCDPQPSVFDAIVAVDASAQTLLRHGGVTAENAVGLVHGAMFTRGGPDLASTAIFVGGSDVTAAEAVYRRVLETFFGGCRVSVMLDPAGANTTAAAAVVAAGRHLPLADPATARRLSGVVLGGTGPVGQRVARLLARAGVAVGVASRSESRAAEVCGRIAAAVPDARLEPLAAGSPLDTALGAADLVVAAGAAGAVLLDAAGRSRAASARVLVDLNAVPPAGIDGIAATDKGRRDGEACVYGALGVGGTKMKIHRAAIARLFTTNDARLDAEELLAIGMTLAG